MKKTKTSSAKNDPTEYFRSLFEESDRGSVLLVGAKLEDDLESLLTAFMRLNVTLSQKEHSELFDGSGPLATFSAKIKLSHAFGFIPDATYRDLLLLKGIRNLAAHSAEDFGFQKDDISKKVFAINAPRRATSNLGEIKENKMKPSAAIGTSKFKDETKLYWLSSGLTLGNEIKLKSIEFLKAQHAKLQKAKSPGT